MEGQVMPRSFSVEVLKLSQFERIKELKDIIAHSKYEQPAKQGVIEILLKKKEYFFQ